MEQQQQTDERAQRDAEVEREVEARGEIRQRLNEAIEIAERESWDHIPACLFGELHDALNELGH